MFAFTPCDIATLATNAPRTAHCWRFVGICGSRLDFVKEFDDPAHRFVENTYLFTLSDPSKLADAEMYKLLLQEYPCLLSAARHKGLIN